MGTRHPKFGSFFSGCGGFDLGFIQAGFRCAGAFDIDVAAVTTHRSNLRSKAEVVDLARCCPDSEILHSLDVLIAGTPCQGFSTVGKRDPADPRNGLLIRAARIAAHLRPKVVLIENVAGAVAGHQRRCWETMLRVLRAADYRVVPVWCDAWSMGVPQQRRRVVALAWNTGQDLTVSFPEEPGGTLRSALASLNGAPNHHPKPLDPSSRAGIIARHIRPNQKLSNVRSGERSVHTWDIPEVFGRTNRDERLVLNGLLSRRRQKRVRDFGDADPVTARALQHFIGKPVAAILHALIRKGYVRRLGQYYDLVHTFNGKFRRLSWDDAAPTVDGRYGDPHYFLHPEEHRAFTVREAARIQGFPDTFVFSGTERSQYQMIGNAVPPPLARSLADFVLASIIRR